MDPAGHGDDARREFVLRALDRRTHAVLGLAHRGFHFLTPGLAVAQLHQALVTILRHGQRAGELGPVRVGEDQQVDPAAIPREVGAIARHRELAPAFLL